MSEDELVQTVTEAVAQLGAQDQITAAGRFFPRGHFGGAFTGGLIGGDAGDRIGGLAGSVGTVGGALAGQHAADAASGLPERMLVGVSADTVYGSTRTRPSTVTRTPCCSGSRAITWTSTSTSASTCACSS